MTESLTIELCMGSSCFARGSRDLHETVMELIATHGWQERVSVVGRHCLGGCAHGPNLKIDGQLHHGLDEGSLLDLLEAKMGVDNPASRSSVRRTVSRRERRRE